MWCTKGVRNFSLLLFMTFLGSPFHHDLKLFSEFYLYSVLFHSLLLLFSIYSFLIMLVTMSLHNSAFYLSYNFLNSTTSTINITVSIKYCYSFNRSLTFNNSLFPPASCITRERYTIISLHCIFLLNLPLPNQVNPLA